MKPFWRDEPLTKDEGELLREMYAAHHASSFRANPASVAAQIAASASGSYVQALIAALSTIGGAHAPLIQTVEFLLNPDAAEIARERLALKQQVVGWGSSFAKGMKDPIWLKVDAMIAKINPDLAATLDLITETFSDYGKTVFPNPSAYTASVAIILRMPAPLAPFLFVAGRLAAWSELILKPQALT